MRQAATHSASLSSLSSWAGALAVFAYITGVLGVVGGLILALQTQDTGFGQNRPYVALGAGVALNSAFFALIGIVLAKLGQAYASSRKSS